MSVSNFNCRLFGGRDVGVQFDSSAQTISILGQSIAISSLSTGLQSAWAVAVASAGVNTGARGAFGGDNVAHAAGEILDAQPTWRNSIKAAFANYNAEQTSSGYPDVESWNR